MPSLSLLRPHALSQSHLCLRECVRLRLRLRLHLHLHAQNTVPVQLQPLQRLCSCSDIACSVALKGGSAPFRPALTLEPHMIRMIGLQAQKTSHAIRCGGVDVRVQPVNLSVSFLLTIVTFKVSESTRADSVGQEEHAGNAEPRCSSSKAWMPLHNVVIHLDQL